MRRISSGPSPFTNYDAYLKFRAARKKEINERWDPKHGWRNMAAKPKMSRHTSSLGNVYEVPDNDIAEFETYYRTMMGNELSAQYEAGTGRLKNVQTPADYIDYAFGKNTKAKIIEQQGVGHINYMWYATRYQLLKVEFWNGTTVVFFRVPSVLTATLFELAQTGGTRAGVDGKPRHLLGIYFWDVVRIRGTAHGSRYKFHYVKDNNTGGLPGRPYGSGDNVWYEEQGMDRLSKRNIDEIQRDLETKQAQRALIEAIRHEPEVLENLRGVSSLNGSVHEMLGQLDADIAEDERIINEIRDNSYDVTRRVKYEAPLKLNAELGDINALDITPGQKHQIEKAIRATVPYDTDMTALENAVIEQYKNTHERKRETERTWTVDRLDSYVDTLANEGKLGSSVDQFYDRFTNAGDQFDYLKYRGLIPPNAIFK